MTPIIIDIALGSTSVIRFSPMHDCVGQVVIGKLYTIGDGLGPVITVTDGSVTGELKKKSVSLPINVGATPKGKYSLKIYTAGTGVIFKSILVIV